MSLLFRTDKQIMKKTLLSGIVALTLLASTTVLAAGFTNGSFENNSISGSFVTLNSVNITDIPGWSIDTGSVDLIRDYWVSQDGSQNVDLNGLAPAKISQTFDTVVGATYTVTFGLSGNPDSVGDQQHPYYSPSNKQVEVSATGATPATYSYDTAVKGNYHGNMKWEDKTYSFIATGTSTTLSFESKITGAFGPALDNVRTIESLPPASTKDQCKKNGWKTMMDSFGNKFKNQGDCVSYFATNGKNLGSIQP
jgi:choice-of-anchor C domain-containing protein